MEHATHLQQLTVRVERLEQRIIAIQQELGEMHQHTDSAALPTNVFSFAWADKKIQQLGVSQIFAALAISGAPRGAQEIQHAMSQAQLHPDELSHSLIEAREN